MKQALTILDSLLGSVHPSTLVVLENYVFLLRKIGREIRAEQLVDRYFLDFQQFWNKKWSG